MSVDTIGNFLTIIRNGVMVSKRSVEAPYSKMKHQISLLLHEEGFIDRVMVDNDVKTNKKILKIMLKYKGEESVIHEIDRVSTPGLRVYKRNNGIKPVIGGLGVSILTTNCGVMTHKKARSLAIGGEVICTVW